MRFSTLLTVLVLALYLPSCKKTDTKVTYNLRYDVTGHNISEIRFVTDRHWLISNPPTTHYGLDFSAQSGDSVWLYARQPYSSGNTITIQIINKDKNNQVLYSRTDSVQAEAGGVMP